MLRSDLGPPVGVIFARLGLDEAPPSRPSPPTARFYADTGMHRARVYPGVPELLDALARAASRWPPRR